jgi:hypothetical protein
MDQSVLQKIEGEISRYQQQHLGERPLYIIMSDDEADNLINEIRKEEGYGDHVVITEYKGSKIVKHLALKTGELQLSNELPESGS